MTRRHGRRKSLRGTAKHTPYNECPIVCDVRDGAIDPLLEVEDFGIVKFARASDEPNPDAAWEPWSRMVAEARTLGKITVACDVAGVTDLGVLVRLGLHYAQGDSLSGWLSDWNFDFVEATTR